MVAMLPLVPLRLRNFAGLRLGHELARRGDGWWIDVSATQTKNGKPYERPFPRGVEVAAAALSRRGFRPALAQRRGRWARPIEATLWVSAHGSPLGEAAVYQQIMLRTEAAFGRPVNPHLFRHGAMTSLAMASPEDVRAGALILGHTNFATSERYYNLARAFDAARRYQEVMEQGKRQRRRR